MIWMKIGYLQFLPLTKSVDEVFVACCEACPFLVLYF